jgi:hypothetical protein
MEIRITYICNGAIYCGFKPDGVEVLEEREVLYPAEGYELERISDKERLPSVWLKDGDVQENYTEVKIDEPDSID